ncbi:MAG: heat shock protein HspQ [Alphaproteobacteria bacterium]|jgi:hemimethylated DNA binding domain|nr:heat shock protein HspQ [Alphaproteobacteria bacterium]MBU0793608.1 heat shock protein HspQ [Alphaproteobacteria bacterium]MBU0876138.1 heat shock protein HspQ [Alphaproteobacteria bacterium]MBU1771029.1 heat shock protein HspQ [Alphaproteobacteria bacterium]
MNQSQARKSFSSASNLPPIGSAPRISHARFGIGDKVRHGLLGFRGVVFDIDPVFANSEEWYEAIPEAMRPARDQPFYHLFADNGEATYVAYVSQQNLVADDNDEPIDHPAVAALFHEDRGGHYALDPSYWH